MTLKGVIYEGHPGFRRKGLEFYNAWPRGSKNPNFYGRPL